MKAVFDSKKNKVEIEYDSVDEQAAILNFLSEYLTYSAPEADGYSNLNHRISLNDRDSTSTTSSLRGIMTSAKDSI